MQNQLGEAKAMYNDSTVKWCTEYTNALREMEQQKYDEITAKVMEYMDVHTKMTEEEKKNEEKTKNKKTGQKPGDAGKKKWLEMFEG